MLKKFKNGWKQIIKRGWQRVLWVFEYSWLALQSIWLYVCPNTKYVKLLNKYAKSHIHHHKNTLAFLKALAINPKTTGAVLPSSKQLAKTMASYITLSENGLVVELGAGTGMITQAILDKGISPDQVIAIECVPHLIRQLRDQFPNITVIEGDATHLTDLLKNQTRPIDTIISGLPLRSLPKETGQAILAQIPALLSDRGKFVQFTYDIRRDEGNYYPSYYRLIDSAIVWRNIPPAKIDVFTFSQ